MCPYSVPCLLAPKEDVALAFVCLQKKTRRWLNDLLLRELAGPLDAADVTALYAPPPWGASALALVFRGLPSFSSIPRYLLSSPFTAYCLV